MQGWRRTALILAGYAGLSFYFTYPLLASGARLGISDWDALLFQHASVFRAVFEYGQAPFWNPWYCGGNVLWANPQAPLISPVYLLAPAMSIAMAMKISIFLHYLAGFAGMHVLLTRVMRVTWYPAVLFVSALFVLAGGAALHLVVGHATFLPYFYLPWFLYCLVRAIEGFNARPVIAAGAILAASIYMGGLYVAYMAGLSAACFAAAAAICRRDWRPLVSVAAIGVFMFLFAAPKLVPVLHHFQDERVVDRRTFHRPDTMSGEMVVQAFTDPYQFPRMRMSVQKYGWHEYGNYLGFLGAPLIAAALLWTFWGRPRPREGWLGLSLAATSLVLFGLMLGEAGRFAPYVWLTKLPLVGDFRLPSRFGLLAVLYGSAVLAWVLTEIGRSQPWSPEARRLVAIVLMAGTASIAYHNRVHFPGAFPHTPLVAGSRWMAKRPAPRLDMGTDGYRGDSPMLRAMFDGRNVVRCNEPVIFEGTVLPRRDLVFGDGVRVSDVLFSPNTVSFGVVTTTEAGRVFFNSRVGNGWNSSLGTLTLAESGPPHVDIPPFAATRVKLRYRPPGLATGFVMLGVGLLAAAWIWHLRRPAQKRDSRRAVVRGGSGP